MISLKYIKLKEIAKKIRLKVIYYNLILRVGIIVNNSYFFLFIIK